MKKRLASVTPAAYNSSGTLCAIPVICCGDIALSSEYNGAKNSETPGNNGSGYANRREMRASNVTGALPVLSPNTPGMEHGHNGSSEFDQLIQSLHELFERDRQMASQQDTTRCGICYLYFAVNDLSYREEGFYVCPACEHALGRQQITMLRKQQKM